ncbi:MAG: methyltransferase domain-containing protein [Desulfobacteraceae bacterium]|jgi:ubiquinone/menaquinone biosynthesis C-methylase UbiE|nr:methyltransferase domain-containing protein [Desulfobacteraceae bacterium]MDH3573944.1 methyltransferase domain-containing protein [Desulfobacteraceae bacterium]MDH3720970.1 methyltransferase domain-containing protein [Desulfobacteraceae bacterium]MDH3836783.1 methyltransferase domain-containing protein [Desulfobacteraceae bacterium]MDH3875435.1 methyltransferase domain-containing protein [Desulfobacteraceae bacterium]
MTEKPIAAGKSSFNLVDSKKLFSELRLKENTTLLDLACGSGAYSIAASEYIGEEGLIYAVDLWKEGIDNLLKEVKIKQINNIHANIADISIHIPMESSCIDVCLMATVLHDLIQDDTDQETLGELKRVLKPNGSLAIIEFKKIEGPPGPPIQIRISPEKLDAILFSHDFRKVLTTDIGPYNYLSIFTFLGKS